MSQDDEAVGAYLYYVHDTSTIDNHTLVDKATSELFSSGSENIASNQVRDIQPSTLEVCLAERFYVRIEETLEPQESQCVASGFGVWVHFVGSLHVSRMAVTISW